MTHPGPTLPELLAWLRELPPVDRARLAGVLVDARTVVAVAALRREAVWEATREASRAEVASALDVSPQAVGKAVTAHVAAMSTKSGLDEPGVEAPDLGG